MSHLPGQPELVGIRAAAALDGLVSQVQLSVQLVRLEQIAGPARVRGFQNACVPSQEDAALQRQPLHTEE